MHLIGHHGCPFIFIAFTIMFHEYGNMDLAIAAVDKHVCSVHVATEFSSMSPGTH